MAGTGVSPSPKYHFPVSALMISAGLSAGASQFRSFGFRVNMSELVGALGLVANPELRLAADLSSSRVTRTYFS